MDIDTDSSSDDTSNDYTTETSTTSSSSDDDDSMMEIAEIDGEKLQLPQGMCEKKEIFQSILSLDTYKNVLTEENRKYLQQFLPKFPSHNNINSDKEQANTIEKLFNYENFYFNNPLEQFYGNLKAGHYRPDIANMKRLILKCELKESKLRYKKYREKLKYDVIESHKKLTEQVNNLPPGIELKVERSNDHHNHHNHSNDLILYRTKRRYYQILSNINSKVNGSNDDYYSPDENYPEGPPASLSRKQRRHLNSIRNSYNNNHNNNSNNGEIFLSTMSTKLTLDLEKYITPQKNPFYINDDNYRTLLSQHKRRRLDRNLDDPDLNTKNINLTDIINRTQLPYLKNIFVNNNNSNKNHIDNKLVNNMVNNQHNKKKMIRKDTSNSDTDSDSSINHNKAKIKPTKPKKIKADVVKKEIIEVISPILPPITTTIVTTTPPTITTTTTILDTPIKSELIEQTYANFFSLIRDIICKTPEHRINYKSLEDLIKKWQENPISPLNDWYNLQQNWLKLLKNAINFLCGNNSSRPENFVPYIEYKLNIDMYQWIGAGRDNDNLLQSLFQYWLEHCNNISSNSNNDDNNVKREDNSGIVDISDRSQTPPPPRCPTTWTVRKATQDEISNYREQERQRYNHPHKAFTYRCNGYESVVGPLKGIYNNHNIINNTSNNTTNITTKAPRGHTMLTDDRPNFVTILSLVRDATARLPNGEGTRSDICELLKSSQYINSTAPDNVLQSIVSGALDRMHTQLDPCVKYDPKRKIWIYLHRNRTEEDFERIHQQLQLISNKNKKQAVKKSSSSQQHQKKVVKNSEKINKNNNETTTVTTVVNTTINSATTTTTAPISTVTTVTNSTTIPSTATSVGNNTNSLLIANQDVVKTNPEELSINKAKNLVRILSPSLNKSLIIPVTSNSTTTKPTTIIKPSNNLDDNNKGIKTNQFVQSIIPQQIQNVKNVTLIKNASDINSNNDKIEQIQIKTPSNLTPAQQQQIIQTIKQKILPQAQIINQQQQSQQQIIFKQKPIVKQQQQHQQQQQQQQSLLGQAKITEVPKTAVITSQTPVVAKVLTNAAGQVISVESLLAHQKQHGSLPQGTTLRVSKSGPPNIIQLTSGTGTPKFAVTSQNNLIALTTNTTNQQKLIVASSASLSPTTTQATTTTTSAITTATTTTTTNTTTTTITTTVKTLPRVIGTTTTIASPRFSAKQLINAKLITTGSGTLTTTPQSRIFVNQQQQQQQQHLKVTPGKNVMLTKPVTLNVATGGNANSVTTNPIRMLNATNLNLTHIGGKPVLLASKGNTIQNLQGHNVLLQTQQSSGNSTSSANSGIVLQTTNIKTTLSQQIFSGNQVKIQQPQVVFSSGVKCAVTQQQQQQQSSQQQQQQLVLEGHPVRLQTNTSTNAQRVVLAASQGQGGQIVAQQILLPAGFQGTAINIKALQGVKVIPLAQAQGRGIPGRPVFARVMNPTIVKTTPTTNTAITTQDKPPDSVVITTTTGTTTTTPD